ncbi:hypothetical protein K9K77_02040 [Candidatus Babeliales bacterium]|nr:hypothetical protein [Candidatus Babeliales bacterium]
MKLSIRSLVLMSIVILPGCGGVTDWVEDTFSQGKEYSYNKSLIKGYLRSSRIYDQFTTVAIFDALWLSDEIRTEYADVYVKVHGRTQDVRNTFLRRQLKANSTEVAFYVLSLNEIPLNVKPMQWLLHLDIDGNKYLPSSVKAAELTPEYVLFFGALLTNHKRVYEVRFDRKDADGKEILNDDAQKLSLVFSGPQHYCALEWMLTSEPRNEE